jgi:D-alanyl-D-alanine carboxypeptidase
MSTVSRRDVLRGTAAMSLATLANRMFAYGQAFTPPIAAAEVNRYMQRYSVPGLSLCYLRGKNLLYSASFGFADLSSKEPVRPQSLFRIASNSKAFTSASIFLLIEAGKLRLEDTVFSPDGVLSQYAKDGKRQDWLHSITVQHLLTHTSGGWSNESDDPMFEKPGFDHDQLIEWTLKTHELKFAPGSHYAYSNFGYCVLGRVIERIAGEPYANFVRQNVLRIVGANDMRIATHKPAPNEVTYYGQNGEQPYNIPITRMDSHGGWISTAEDMARFLASVFSPVDQEGAPPLLRPSSIQALTTATTANPGYACGLAVNRVGNAWHNGSLPGTVSLMVHTKTGCSWAAVMNTRTSQGNQQPDLDRMLWDVARSTDWHA